MQNSLDRLLAGIEHTLRDVVAPTIEDPYVRTQLSSVTEIISNLSTRVEWRCDQLRDVITRIRPLLAETTDEADTDVPLARAALDRPAPIAGTTNAELVRSRDEHLRALQEVQRARVTGDELDARLRTFLGWQVETESSLLRSGMFSAPKKQETP